jgi:GT2 family glycosyltransferase
MASSLRPCRVSVVVCVHDALDDVAECLASLHAQAALPFELVLVDDGSAAPTQRHLAAFAATHGARLVRHEAARGYTASANEGLRLAGGEWVVLLNSDTVVARGWLEKLLECGAASPRTGIVGPLSNAACWQSVPSMRGWITRRLPRGILLQEMAALVEAASRRRFPRVTLVNGFCFAVRREVIERIGFFDEAAFPIGYGEENDYCLRAAGAGFELRLADHAFVQHKKARSFSRARRVELVKAGDRRLVERHPDYRERVAEMDRHPELPAIRRRVRLRLLLRRLGWRPGRAAIPASALGPRPSR